MFCFSYSYYVKHAYPKNYLPLIWNPNVTGNFIVSFQCCQRGQNSGPGRLPLQGNGAVVGMFMTRRPSSQVTQRVTSWTLIKKIFLLRAPIKIIFSFIRSFMCECTLYLFICYLPQHPVNISSALISQWSKHGQRLRLTHGAAQQARGRLECRCAGRLTPGLPSNTKAQIQVT